MDPGIVVMIMMGMLSGAITIVSVVRHLARSRHLDGKDLARLRKAVLEDLKQDLRSSDPDEAIEARVAELKQSLDSQGDRINELAEENQFLRRLLEDKTDNGG